jgi:hypothetical protein
MVIPQLQQRPAKEHKRHLMARPVVDSRAIAEGLDDVAVELLVGAGDGGREELGEELVRVGLGEF